MSQLFEHVKYSRSNITSICLSKVAVHSYVENLFSSIWGMPHCRAPHAIKYFFDFLDTQADSMKISDPDVLHIWKTNRYWSMQLSEQDEDFCNVSNVLSARLQRGIITTMPISLKSAAAVLPEASLHPLSHLSSPSSLPLRFWVNILKNPQFVFDMEKMPHLDGCLSVIAQAFMDSFSLSENQLGKVTRQTNVSG